MAKPLLTDELWERIEPLLPPEPPKPKRGRRRVRDRACLTGILFILRTGMQWELLPPAIGSGIGMPCWRRLRDCHEAGIWQDIWQAFLNELGRADGIDGSAAAIDSCSPRAFFGGQSRAPIPAAAAGTARNAICTPAAAAFR